jgi:hypothetical protein
VQDFDPVRHILEHVPSEENELMYFEEQVLLSRKIELIFYSVCMYCHDVCTECCTIIRWSFVVSHGMYDYNVIIICSTREN